MNVKARSMKLRTILCQAEAVSQENSVTLMDKLSLTAAFSWALLYEPNEPIVPSENREVELAKQHGWFADAFSNYQLNHPVKLIHVGIRLLLSHETPVEPHGVGAKTGSRSSPCWATQRQSDPDLTLQLCVPPTTMWPLRFLRAQQDVLSNYNNINIMSFPCSAAWTLM